LVFIAPAPELPSPLCHRLRSFMQYVPVVRFRPSEWESMMLMP
jgi:hypothetical protein